MPIVYDARVVGPSVTMAAVTTADRESHAAIASIPSTSDLDAKTLARLSALGVFAPSREYLSSWLQ